MLIERRSIAGTFRYGVSGVCEACGEKYHFDVNEDIGASTTHKAITNQHLAAMAKGKNVGSFWDTLTHVYREPGRFGMRQPCPRCRHLQSWMRLGGDPGDAWFDRLLRWFEAAPPDHAVARPTAAHFSIGSTAHFSISRDAYPPEIPFGLADDVQACLHAAVATGVPRHYVKYLAAVSDPKAGPKLGPRDHPTLLAEIGWVACFQGLPPRRRREPKPLPYDVLFAVCLRGDAGNWRSLARVVEFARYQQFEPALAMRLLLPPDKGGLADRQIDDPDHLLRFLGIDPCPKDFQICRRQQKTVLVPCEPAASPFVCPLCGETHDRLP